MVAQILEPNQTEFFLCGVSFLDATADNLIYKLRYSYSPRNSGEQGYILKIFMRFFLYLF